MVFKKGKVIVATMVLGISLLIYDEENLSYAYGDSNYKYENESQKQIDISGIIKDVNIKDKDNLYISDEYVKTTFISNDKNIESIKLDNNNFYRLYNSDEFNGSIYTSGKKEYKAKELVINYKDGSKISVLRNESNEEIFAMFDLNMKEYTIKSIYVENREDLEVGDKRKIILYLNENDKYVEGLKLMYKNSETNQMYYVDLIYNKEKSRYESNDDIYVYYDDTTPFDYRINTINEDGKNTLMKIYTGKTEYRPGLVMGVEILNRESSEESMKQGDYGVSPFNSSIKEIKVMNKDTLFKGEINLRAEVEDSKKIKSIKLLYKKMARGWQKIDFELNNKQGNIIEGIQPFKVSMNDSDGSSELYAIEVHKTNGGMLIYNDKSVMEDYLATAKLESKWLNENGYWYFYDYGNKKTGWFETQGKRYLCDEEGRMKTGWQNISDKWYYLNPSGDMVRGWKQIGGKWYYLKKDGTMETGWGYIYDKWYYLENSGVMATGWKNVNGRWYYLDASGAMKTGWQKISGKWYYLNPSGDMAIGWKDINGTWYYLDCSGAMKTGWQNISGQWYYLYSSGAMAKNATIDGWKINSNGVATKIK